MRKIEITADELFARLVKLAENERVAVLDSCGVGSKPADLLIAAFDPVEVVEVTNSDPVETLRLFDKKLAHRDLAAIFTLSYDFGGKVQNIGGQSNSYEPSFEPDIYIALFDTLIIHDYAVKQTFLSGDRLKFDAIEKKLLDSSPAYSGTGPATSANSVAVSNFTKAEYLSAIKTIKELIRRGDTYQTNLTQQLSVPMASGLSAVGVFANLRSQHPAPFSAYIDRGSSHVVSASPEQFIRVSSEAGSGRTIFASPIKGTRPRGDSPDEDRRLRADLLNSQKDRAENTMIVDLMRNDLGRICEFGSVKVDSLCTLEEHPTLFHLVSTITGKLRETVGYSDILRAVFPCGSITGAPKLRTMEIIDDLETAARGLSMGAIGFNLPGKTFGMDAVFEMSVAIRTMVVRGNRAVFNVGGGIVIDSDPESEYQESLLKAKALLRALNSDLMV